MMNTTRILLLPLLLANIVASAATATTTSVVSSSSLFDSDSSESQHQHQRQSDQSDQEQNQKRNLQGSIKDKWAISDPPTWSYSDLDFFIEFQVSNYIIPGQAHVGTYIY
jgi:hypothetical protein